MHNGHRSWEPQMVTSLKLLEKLSLPTFPAVAYKVARLPIGKPRTNSENFNCASAMKDALQCSLLA
eukprot:scaffold244229_cov18-Tisochrysis_lutea.AAC.1